MKKRIAVPFEEIEAEFMKDPGFRKAVKELEPEYEIISQIIKARIEQNITQEELDPRAHSWDSFCTIIY